MRRPLCRKQRWFHAVAMTCLAGFALSGCARGSRDVSKSLQENAEREAIEAERHVAERKKQESSAKSREILQENDFDARDSREEDAVARTNSSSDDPWKTTALGSDEEASAEDDSIRTVSGSEEVADLLSQSETEPVQDLFDRSSKDSQELESDSAASPDESDSEGLVRIHKEPPAEAAPPRSKSEQTRSTARSGQPSYRGAQEHPWARKSPVVQTPAGEERPTQAESQREIASRMPESQLVQSTEQTEAKARISVLVNQAKSLLEKGEYRSAYRAAQVAQRMAESNDVYFAAGEDQPADVVRSVLAKIRSSEAQVAHSVKPKSREVIAQRKPAAVKPESSVETTDSRKESAVNPFEKHMVSKLPDGWKFAEWQGGEPASPATEKKDVTPPTVAQAVTQKAPSLAGMSIRPKPRSEAQAKPFPTSGSWKEVREAEVAQSSGTSAESPSAEVIPSLAPHDLPHVKSGSSSGSQTAGGQLLVPRPFPKPVDDPEVSLGVDPAAAPPQLAAGPDWRSESLDSAGTGRMPLLVAPMPPQEPAADSLSEIVDDTLAVETDDAGSPKSESRLWMMLAAAAGAFALLFVRRRPAAPVRASETKSA